MSHLLPLFLVLAAPITAATDDLGDILERDKVAVQKLVNEVNDALSQAKTLEKTDLTRAKKLLEATLGKIADAKELVDDQRAGLRQRVQVRLAEVNRQMRAQEQAADDNARRTADKAKRDKQTNPTGPSTADTAKKFIGTTQDQIAAAQQLREQRAKGGASVFSSLEVAATPIDGVVEYPKYWAKLTESRKNRFGTRLSEKEVALLKSLNSTMSVDFKGFFLKDVLEYIQEKTGMTIIVDESSLKEANADYNDPVTFKASNITARTVLKKVLADHGLAYILKEGTVQVVTPQRARETMVVRSYPIDDLVGGNPQLYGPFLNRALMLNNVQQLIQTIQNAIDPALWNVNGGPGSITFFEPGRALIIRAPAEMHYMFGGSGLFGR
jgi:hypothetical protein